MHKIAILLCTFNGEKYLSQQIDSLLKQSYQNFVIYIHDDGSTDDTFNIIKDYKEKYSNKITIKEDEFKGRGAKNSFMWLLNEVHADYYMFCDQDDIWLENKIQNSYNRIIEVEANNPDKPIAIHTDLTLVDQDLNIIHNSFWQYSKFNVDWQKKIYMMCFGNIATGCTMIFNNPAKLLSLPIYKYANMHDYCVAIICSKYGILENLKQQTILYRQHENNVIGCGKPATLRIFPKKGLKGIINHYKINKELYNAIQIKSFFLIICYGMFCFLYRTILKIFR